MNTVIRLLVSFVLALLVVTPASADWVLSGFLGSATTTKSWLAVAQPNRGTNLRFQTVDYSGESFRSPIYYGYRVTYYPAAPGWFGVEAELIHLKVFAATDALSPTTGTLHGINVSTPVPIRTVVQRFSLSHGQNMILFSGVVRRVLAPQGTSWNEARVTVVGRAGAGPTVPHAEAEIDGVSEEHYQWARWAVQAAGGLEVRMWKGLHALGEYKFTRCRQRVSAAGSTIETPLRSHHLAFGAAWHF